ncbi:hypothetical protein Goari_007341 [Gossypium aridum]|uniref:HMA domain-containing protein n=1 Tax=Gossypium aridum TaxID=34290 RepID=A0A7J8XRD0_GOSAI|nr:hypothetical protein [Gossypium aridum]
MSANMGCAQCREKVSKVTSKMTGRNFDGFHQLKNCGQIGLEQIGTFRIKEIVVQLAGLREYTVDVSNKQVVVKADFGFRWKLKNEFSKTEKRKYWHVLGVLKCLGLICFCKQIALAD